VNCANEIKGRTIFFLHFTNIVRWHFCENNYQQKSINILICKFWVLALNLVIQGYVISKYSRKQYINPVKRSNSTLHPTKILQSSVTWQVITWLSWLCYENDRHLMHLTLTGEGHFILHTKYYYYKCHFSLLFNNIITILIHNISTVEYF